MAPARRRLVVFSAAVLTALAAVLAVALPAGTASAAGRPAAGNRVWAFPPAAQVHVRADRDVSAGQRLGEAASCPICAPGSCGAPEEAGAGADIGATTAHGAERVAGAGATRGGVLSPDEILNVRSVGEVWSQADGATVRILQNGAGRYDIVVEGDRGLITTFKNLSQKSFDRLANNYGWTP